MPSAASSEKSTPSFPPTSKKEWTEAANQELGKGNSIETLVRVVDGLHILPYYDATDASPSIEFQLPVSQNEFSEPRDWSNTPRIATSDVSRANLHALSALNSGADGIVFDLEGMPDPAELLKHIELPFCQVIFLARPEHISFFRSLCSWAASRGYDIASIRGAIFWKQTPDHVASLPELFEGWRQFAFCGLIGGNTVSPSDEISSLLAKAVKQIEAIDENAKAHEVLKSIAFSTAVATDFFLEIAKLKALRFLWARVMSAFDAPSANLFVHVTSPSWNIPAYAPHGNMLKSTTAALSAILGGCDALTVEPEDKDNALMQRIALNVSSVLKDESRLGKVADPVAGSYYLDRLTDDLAKESWKKFQKLVKP